MSRVLQTTLQGIVTLISCFGLAGCGLLFPYPANYSPYSPYGQPYPGQPYPTAPGYGTPQYPASPGYPAYPGYNSPGYPVTPGYPSGRPGGPPITWNPVTPIGSPSPFGPIVLNPQPSGPVLKPVTNPTDQPVPIPGGNNAPPNVVPPTGDVTAEWAAWPLPPRRQPAIAQGSGILNSTGPKNTSASPDGADGFQLINDGTPSPAEDLQYHGGKTLQNIEYVNLYIGGDEVWDREVARKIDRAIFAAMTDPHLDNVVRQYFQNKPIGTRAHASHPLVGYVPQRVMQGDVHYYLEYLYRQGYLNSYDLDKTVFNFLCPPGTILSIDEGRANSSTSGAIAMTVGEAQGNGQLSKLIEGVLEEVKQADSNGGLGGYHGSIRINGKAIYYSTEVYSEKRSDGFRNGIPVFAESWKNVVATLYHELQEVRTNPDVEDVIRNPYDPRAASWLGWTSDSGEEIGDYPLHAGVPITSVIREVPLADGSGTVPVQFNYSNAVHGPEGPIPNLNPPAN